MSEELTLEKLREAISLIDARNKREEIIGYIVNPADLRKLKSQTAVIAGADAIKLFIVPCQGIELYESADAIEGYPIPIRRKDKEIEIIVPPSRSRGE